MIRWIEDYCSKYKRKEDKRTLLKIHSIEGNKNRDEILNNLSFDKGEIEAKRYPTGKPAIKDVYDAAAKLYAESISN